MKTWVLVAIAGLAGVLIGALAPLDETSAPPPTTPPAGQSGDSFTIAGGWLTGAYYPAAGAICNQAVGGGAAAACSVRPSHGSIENIESLRSGQDSFAIVQTDWQYHAYNGSSLFDGQGAFPNLRSVMTLYGEAASLLVREGVEASHMEDLKGLRINIGEAGSGTAATWQALAEAADWSGEDLGQISQEPPLEAIAALCAGELDALFWIVGHPSSVTLEVISNCGARLLPVDGEAAASLIEDNAYFLQVTIPAQSYPGQEDALKTLGVGASLVTRADVPADLVKGVTAAVLANIDAFRGSHPSLTGFATMVEIEGGLTAPLHEGAGAALDESGAR